jgi:hypothetical protein
MWYYVMHKENFALSLLCLSADRDEGEVLNHKVSYLQKISPSGRYDKDKSLSTFTFFLSDTLY